MNLKEIKEMVKLMNDNGLSEIELEREGCKIKISKGGTVVSSPIVAHPAQHMVPAAPQAAAQPAAQEKAPAKTGKDIIAPMVGTFYRAPSPESPPYAEVGKVVEIGQVVCIIEAMKLMNEIKSEVRGKIVEILIDNAQPVEFGQPLFVVDPV